MEQIAGIAVQGIRACENFKCEVICIYSIPKGITYKEGIKIHSVWETSGTKMRREKGRSFGLKH